MFTNIVFAFIHTVALSTCLLVTLAPSTSVHPAIRVMCAIMTVTLIGLSVFTASIYLLQQQQQP